MFIQPRPSAPASLYASTSTKPQPPTSLKNRMGTALVLFQGMLVTVSQAVELSQR